MSNRFVKFTALGGMMVGFAAVPGTALALSNNDSATAGTTGPVDITVSANLGGAITLYVSARATATTLLNGTGASGTVDFGNVDTSGGGELTGQSYTDGAGAYYVAELTASVEYTGYDQVRIDVYGTKSANFDTTEEKARWACGAGEIGSGAWAPAGALDINNGFTLAASPGNICGTLTGGAGQANTAAANRIDVDLAFYFADSADVGAFTATYNFTGIGQQNAS